MRKNYLLNSWFILFILFISVNIFSCSSTQKVKYFQDIPDSGQLKTIAKAEYYDPKIQVDDILTIIVETVDPSATAMINSGNVTVGASQSPSTSALGASSLPSSISQQIPVTGYLVDKDGYVTIPILGRIEAAGHTTFELRDIVNNAALKYYNTPTVIVRFSNFKVTVTGEVLKPGQYIMPNEKVSIIDAIAMAGDLTIFGKRENVLLIRENPDGTKTPYRVNLKKSDVMSAPYYYLRQNDIIYVEPRKAKSDATDAAQTKYVGIASALLTLVIVLATRVK
jgi:polysaccharide export outer membrane protein